MMSSLQALYATSSSQLSPFTPGRPVSVELFTGRQNEIEELARCAYAAANGRLETAFLTGERGIGKSTLASFVQTLSEHRHNLLTLHVFMGGAKTVDEMVRRVFDRIVKDGHDTTWFDRLRTLFGNHIQTLDLFGIQVGFQPSAVELARLAENFDTALLTVLDRLGGEKPAIMIVLDDINGLAESPEFAHWLKSFVDSMAVSQKRLPLFLLLVGLEERRRSLIHSNPSLARVFHLVDIRPWSLSETEEFYQKAFDSVDVVIDERAMVVMTTFAGGLPVLAHEIGEAALRIDTDKRISFHDAISAVRSAADVVGHKHIDPQVFRAIRSKHYRQILQKIPQNFGLRFKRADVKEHLENVELKVFDNFLRKMRKLGVLAHDQDEGSGWYRFTSNLHWVYFLSEAERSRAAEW